MSTFINSFQIATLLLRKASFTWPTWRKVSGFHSILMTNQFSKRTLKIKPKFKFLQEKPPRWSERLLLIDRKILNLILLLEMFLLLSPTIRLKRIITDLFSRLLKTGATQEV